MESNSNSRIDSEQAQDQIEVRTSISHIGAQKPSKGFQNTARQQSVPIFVRGQCLLFFNSGVACLTGQ